MSWYNGIYSLVRAVSEIWKLKGGICDTVIARGLGFYIYIPGKDKFYSYMRNLNEQFVENIMLDFTEKLIKDGVVDLYQIIIDNTTIMKRKDSIDDKSKVHEHGSPDQCYKFQLLTDASQTPLVIVRRDGEEYDSNGLKNIENRILRLKEITDKHGKKIEYFLADAGYFDMNNLKFIKEKLGAKFIIDISPRRSSDLSKIKKLLNECKKLISIIYSRNSGKASDRTRAEITLKQKISRLELFLRQVESKG
ncbi:MAG: transposase, partial [Candidatus Helarchaeota archaeon]